jgi:hypothetical protein
LGKIYGTVNLTAIDRLNLWGLPPNPTAQGHSLRRFGQFSMLC